MPTQCACSKCRHVLHVTTRAKPWTIPIVLHAHYCGETNVLHRMHVCLHACMQIHGDGVYTYRSYKKGDKLLLLLGMYIPHKVRTTPADNRYAFKIRCNQHTDGMRMHLNKECNIGKFVNSPVCTMRLPNCTPMQPTKFKFMIFLVATRDIRKGRELICNYELQNKIKQARARA